MQGREPLQSLGRCVESHDAFPRRDRIWNGVVRMSAAPAELWQTSGTIRGMPVPFRLRACANAAPFRLALSGDTDPSPRNVDTMVVSIASWAPWKSGNPSATTSSRRPSKLRETLAPASLHTRAAAFSSANPRRPNTPALEHAARWWPLGSSGRPHRQVREDSGRGRLRRLNNRTRNSCASKRENGEVGKQVNGSAASGPLCDLRRRAADHSNSN